MSLAPDKPRILVIKLSALGDFIQALGPMAAIRKHHKDVHITLLTTKAFKGFGEQCGYFDDVWIDARPKLWGIKGWLNLRRHLLRGHFTRIYDLQNNDRTALYFRLFPRKKKPEWVGAVKGASHSNTSHERTAGHALEGHIQTLALTGITDIKIDDLAWIKADLSGFELKPPYVLLVPGSAPQHPQKRWPSEQYAALGNKLAKHDFQPVLLGTEAEKEVTRSIRVQCPDALDLTGQTSLFQIAALAHGAQGAVGNDTGPMHMIGPTGCPCLVLFSGHSNPQRHAPKGEAVIALQENDLENLGIENVWNTLEAHLKHMHRN